MGLLDSLKGNKKEKEPRFCYRCGKDCSGFLNAITLKGEKYICHDCFPANTKLSCKQDALQKRIGALKPLVADVEEYILCRNEIARRREQFQEEESYLKGQILVDRTHMWFKFKQYEEVFPLNEIFSFSFAVFRLTTKYEIKVLIGLQNSCYTACVLDPISYHPKAILKRNELKEIDEFLSSIHAQLCPDALYDWVDKKNI